MIKDIRKLYWTPYFDLISIDGYFMIEEKEKINGAVVVPVFSDGSLLLIEHYRPAINKSSVEFPRGSKDKGESNVEAGLRELEEETGFRGKEAVELGILHANSSFIRSGVAVVKVLVDDTAMQNNRIELEGEAQAAVRYTLSEVRRMICDGTITCGHTLSALAMLLAQDSSINLH